MRKSKLQEQLATLYLRLNGFFTTGFIIHSPQGDVNSKGKHRSNRTELDIIAVRFPNNAEPEREYGCSEYLQTSSTHIDILICEVKGQDEDLIFNKGLRLNKNSIYSMLNWIGAFSNEEISQLVTPVQDILSTEYPISQEKFRELIAPRNFRIRGVFFAPDRSAPDNQQRRFIYGDEIIDYIWQCFMPEYERANCQTRYNFGLWGEFEEVVRFFKDRGGNKPQNMQEIYNSLVDK